MNYSILHILYIATALISHLSLFLFINKIMRMGEDCGYKVRVPMGLYIPLTIISIIPLLNILLFIICIANLTMLNEEILQKWLEGGDDEE